MNRLVLGEYETLDEAELPLDEAELPLEEAVALATTGAVEVLRTASPGRWTLRAGKYVGVVRVGETEVQIRPKVPVARLLYLLGYGGVVRSQFRSWLDEDGRIPVRPDLTWWSQGHCIAVVDAKYKALRLAEAPPTPTCTRCSPTAR